MKICFICHEYPPDNHGGIGTVTQILARALVREGHEVKVLGIYSNCEDNACCEDDRGVEVWRFAGNKTKYPFRWILDRLKLLKIINRWIFNKDVDLVEIPDWHGWAAFWPKLSIPVVIRVHGTSSYFQNELNLSVAKSTFFLERASLRRADALCSVSYYASKRTDEIFDLHSKYSVILYNPVNVPVNLAEFQTRSPEKVIFTGTLTQKKGVISLIDAWSRVIKIFPGGELDIYGKDGRTESGQSMQHFLEQRLDGKCRDSIHFYGHVDRDLLYKELSNARAAVFPSYAEAFAVAPLEAMACGCPTIYSKFGSGSELIEHAVNGLLIDPKDPIDIANAIILVLQDKQLAKRLSVLGRKRIESTFTLEQLLPLNIQFYQNAIENFKNNRSVKCL